MAAAKDASLGKTIGDWMCFVIVMAIGTIFALAGLHDYLGLKWFTRNVRPWPTASPEIAQQCDQVTAAMEAIAKIESSTTGNYKAIGKEIQSGSYKGDRAYGRYQIMGLNLAEWSGGVYTQADWQRFLDNPADQDTIARNRISAYWERYGNIRDVASLWHAGKPFAEITNESDGISSTRNYVSVVEAYFNQSPCGEWQCPTVVPKITSQWGWRNNPRPAFHDAWDMRAARGSPVFAAHAGKVVVKQFDADGCGKYLDIENALDPSIKTRYCHLDEYLGGIELGSTVSAGQQIGLAGSTGNAKESEPHLHFEVIKAGSEQNPNPALYLPRRCWDPSAMQIAQATP